MTLRNIDRLGWPTEFQSFRLILAALNSEAVTTGNGYVSGKEAFERGIKPTYHHLLNEPDGYRLPLDDYSEDNQKALHSFMAWVETKSSASDFWREVKTYCAPSLCTAPVRLAIITEGARAHHAQVDRDGKRIAAMIVAAVRLWCKEGTPTAEAATAGPEWAERVTEGPLEGGRQDMAVDVVEVIQRPEYTINVGVTSEGHCVFWYGSALEVGNTYGLRGTPQNQREFRGIIQTRINRVSLAN